MALSLTATIGLIAVMFALRWIGHRLEHTDDQLAETAYCPDAEHNLWRHIALIRDSEGEAL